MFPQWCCVVCCYAGVTGDDSSQIAKPHRRRQARGLEDSAEEGDGRSMFACGVVYEAW